MALEKSQADCMQGTIIKPTHSLSFPCVLARTIVSVCVRVH